MFFKPKKSEPTKQESTSSKDLAIITQMNQEFATSLDLRYMHEILSESSISNKEMIMGLAPYGDYPTFSLSVNHYQTYTGITDKDRALTINEMANIYNIENKQKKLMEHQSLVLKDWVDNNFFGIIKHATGSGKTITGINGIREWLKINNTVIVLVKFLLP